MNDYLKGLMKRNNFEQKLVDDFQTIRNEVISYCRFRQKQAQREEQAKLNQKSNKNNNSKKKKTKKKGQG